MIYVWAHAIFFNTTNEICVRYAYGIWLLSSYQRCSTVIARNILKSTCLVSELLCTITVRISYTCMWMLIMYSNNVKYNNNDTDKLPVATRPTLYNVIIIKLCWIIQLYRLVQHHTARCLMSLIQRYYNPITTWKIGSSLSVDRWLIKLICKSSMRCMIAALIEIRWSVHIRHTQLHTLHICGLFFIV